MDSSLKDVYDKAVSSLVSQALDGYNVCVMAYGQTGSGKTYWFGIYHCSSYIHYDLKFLMAFFLVC